MKAILFGSNGQLGYEISKKLKSLGWDVKEPSSQEIDVGDIKKTTEYIKENNPDHVINCTAFHDVNECEKDLEKTFKINSVSPCEMARACEEVGAVFVHFSTDYIFSGKGRTEAYIEEDKADPLMAYGVSKLAGELQIPALCKKHFVFRVASLYGPKGPSAKAFHFVDLMLKLGKERDKVQVVNDQTMSPTNCVDVAERLPTVIQSDKYGLYHLTNEGHCTWFDLCTKIFETAGYTTTIEPVPTEHFPAGFNRPKFTALANKRYNENFDDKMPSWQESVEKYVKEKMEKS